MNENAEEYLARLSKVLQLHGDERMRQLAGHIVRLWTTESERSAVGVSVGRSAADHVPARPLQGLVAEFGFPDQARYEGVIIEIPDLFTFAEAMRLVIMKGIV